MTIKKTTTLESLDKKIDLLAKDLSSMKKTYPKKDDLKNLLTKEDGKKFATKDDLKSFLTKEDGEKFATKDDLKSFLTKEDGEKFATKEALDNLTMVVVKNTQDIESIKHTLETKIATKDDINRVFDVMDSFSKKWISFDRRVEIQGHLIQNELAPKVSDHEKRITALENFQIVTLAAHQPTSSSRPPTPRLRRACHP